MQLKIKLKGIYHLYLSCRYVTLLRKGASSEFTRTVACLGTKSFLCITDSKCKLILFSQNQSKRLQQRLLIPLAVVSFDSYSKLTKLATENMLHSLNILFRSLVTSMHRKASSFQHVFCPTIEMPL